MNKIKIFIENPKWSFVGTFFGILAFFEVSLNMVVHIVIQYTILAIALFLAIHGIYRLSNRKDSIKDKKEPLSQKPPEYDISDDCVFDDTLGSPGWLINRRTNEVFCYDCKGEDNSKIHLIRKNLSEWFCPKCKRPYDSRARMWKDLFMKKRRLL